jgi:hypothetical protein
VGILDKKDPDCCTTRVYTVFEENHLPHITPICYIYRHLCTKVETKIFVFVFSRKKISLFAKKAYENFRFRESFRENFREIFQFRKIFRENFLFGMWIRIQEPPECVSRTESLVENFRKNRNFSRKPTREQQFFAKTFAKTKTFEKRKFSVKLSRKRKFSRNEISRKVS